MTQRTLTEINCRDRGFCERLRSKLLCCGKPLHIRILVARTKEAPHSSVNCWSYIQPTELRAVSLNTAASHRLGENRYPGLRVDKTAYLGKVEG